MWKGHGGTVSKIVDMLSRKGWRFGANRQPVFRTLQRHVAGQPLATRGGGAPPKLTKGEALVAAKYVELGLAYEQVAYMVSAHRADKGKGPVSRTSVETAFYSTLGGIERPRGTRTQGSYADENGVWRTSRVALATQLTEQLQERNLAAERGRRDGSVHASKMKLEQILWSDENHQKIIIGDNASTMERVLPRTPGGSHRLVEDGGEYPEPDARLLVKNETDGGRMAMAVMMKQNDETGELEGHKAEPFDYSGTTVVGPTTFRERWDAELARVEKLDGGIWRNVRHQKVTPRYPGGRYQVLYGDDVWEAKVREACKRTIKSPSLKGLTCVTEIMDHLVKQGDKLFKGTPFEAKEGNMDKWILYHDALTAWWEEDAQRHLLDVHGIGPSRQICCQGDTNDVVGKRYVNKITGNDPNLDPLDTNLFADYKRDISRAVAYTRTQKDDDPVTGHEKYKMRTAKDVRETMLRVWKWSVTSERIVQDISRWPSTLERIIDAKGAVLPKKRPVGKRPRTREFQPPPDCPLTTAALRAECALLDPISPPQTEQVLPPKKRRGVL